MTRTISALSRCLLLTICAVVSAQAQTSATYHLHNDTTNVYELKTTAPDKATIAITSANLKGVVAGEYLVKTFDTPTGVPNKAGIIPAGSTITFTLWLKKTTTSGTMFPRAKLFLNSTTGTQLGMATGVTALTSTLTKYTLSVTVASDITAAATDRFSLWVGVNMTVAPTTNTNASLNFEGTLNGNYDSQVVVPLPTARPTVSVTAPASGATFTAPATININAAASDADGTVSKVEFFQGTTKLGEDTTSPFSFTWSNVAASSYGYSITAKATDNAGATATSSPVNLYVTGNGSLAGSFATPTTPATVDLTAEGLSDWAHWGLNAVNSFDRRSDVTQQISNYSSVGTNGYLRFFDNPTSFNWSDGTPTANVAATPTGIYTTGAGNGFQIHVPADTNLKTLKLYVGLWCAQGRLEVTLSDNSALAYLDNSLGGNCFTRNAVYTINFKAGSGGQTLVVKYSVLSDYNPPSGNVTLTSATLSGGSVSYLTPGITGLSPTQGGVGTSVTISGSNFGARQGTSVVKFNGVSATVTTWTNTGIVAAVPAGATTGLVNVTTGGGSSNGASFTVTPKINSLTPAVGTIGTLVTIGGYNFGATQGTSVVTFNGVAVAPASWSNTGITVNVPSGITTGPVVVTVGGHASNGVTFTIGPKINSLSPATGPTGTSVNINGSSFGTTQGASTVTFNGVLSAPTSWNDTAIVAPVPMGATTGPVVVTTGGVASSGVTYTVASGAINGAITRASDGSALGGALVEALQASVVKGTATSASNGGYSVTGLTAGTYDVRVSATGYPTNLRNGISVAYGTPATVNVALNNIGSVNGKVTRNDGTTAIAGASVKLYQGATTAGTTTSNATGDYTFASLTAGAYSIEASASGYGTSTRNGVAVGGGAATTVNLKLATIESGPVAYVYDELGRLLSVVGQTTTATYAYDSVGNLLSVSTQSSSQVSLAGFTPGSGPVGTPVNINGSGFSPVANQNTVTFNGVSASVQSATATQIITSVPAGATTGLIGVTAPNGSAQSATAFNVTAGGASPTITNFTPALGNSNTAVNITGTNFETNAADNKVKFNGFVAPVSAATATSISASAPPVASGRVSVTTPAGAAISANDFYVVPAPYTVANVDTTSRVLNGESRAVTLSTGGKIGIVIFDATSGQRTSIKLESIAIPFSNVTVYRPDGAVLNPDTVSSSSYGEPQLLEFKALPSSGTYAIVVLEPNGYTNSTMTLTVYSVPPDTSATITAGGGPLPLTTTVPGQNIRSTFNGIAGQKVSLDTTDVTISSALVNIYKPDGTALNGGMVARNFMDTMLLPASGTYTVVVDPQGATTGSVTLALYDVVDVTGTITIGGPSVPITINTLGQNASLTFAGTAGQRISLNMSGVTIPNSNVIIKQPDGSTLASAPALPSGGFIDTQTLTATGTYTIVVDPLDRYTGNITLTLYDVPPDITGTITQGAAAQTVTINSPGQNARLSFNGTAGQKLSLNTTNPNFSDTALISILNPDGTALTGIMVAGNMTTAGPLSVGGTYTILVDPQRMGTGSVALALYDATDVTRAVVVNGATQSINLNPGQEASLTFDGVAGQQATVRLTGSTIGFTYVSLLKPDGSILTDTASSNSSFNLPQQTLPVAGTYTIKVKPNWTNSGSISVSVTSP